MSQTSITDSYDALLSTTFPYRVKQLWDNLVINLQLLKWMEGGQVKATGLHGHRYEFPLLYGSNTTVKNRGGYDIVDLDAQDGITIGYVPWKDLSGSVVISDDEKRQNAGEERILSLLDAKTQQLEITMRTQLNTDLFSDGGTSNQIYGLAYWFRTASATVAGIDDSVNTWWANKSSTLAGSFASNGRDKMRTMWNNCSLGFNSDTPTHIMTDQTTYEAYEKTLDSAERLTIDTSGPDKVNIGPLAITFKGSEVAWDSKCTSGYMYFLNLRDKKLRFNILADADFVTTPFIRPANQRVVASIMTVQANVACHIRKRMGLITGFTA